MSAALVFFAAFLTGVSGSPGVTMKPDINLGFFSSVPDTTGEAHFMEAVRFFFFLIKQKTHNEIHDR